MSNNSSSSVFVCSNRLDFLVCRSSGGVLNIGLVLLGICHSLLSIHRLLNLGRGVAPCNNWLSLHLAILHLRLGIPGSLSVGVHSLGLLGLIGMGGRVSPLRLLHLSS